MTELEEVLARARERKFLGSLPLADHVANGEGFARAIGERSRPDAHVVDLGSGGGVPALVIAAVLPATTFVLVERGERRAEFLVDAVDDLGFGARVEVVVAEAEDAARDDALMGAADVVTARSFAPPAVTAECARRFLVDDGLLVVSEPPAAPERWSIEGLAMLGFSNDGVEVGDGYTLQFAVASAPCPDRYPRRAGTTRKRPLW